MARTKLSVTVEGDLVKRIQRLATQQSQPLSRLVEEALQAFLKVELDRELEEGYRAMADLDLALAEADVAAGYEALPDA